MRFSEFTAHYSNVNFQEFWKTPLAFELNRLFWLKAIPEIAFYRNKGWTDMSVSRLRPSGGDYFIDLPNLAFASDKTWDSIRIDFTSKFVWCGTRFYVQALQQGRAPNLVIDETENAERMRAFLTQHAGEIERLAQDPVFTRRFAPLTVDVEGNRPGDVRLHVRIENSDGTAEAALEALRIAADVNFDPSRCRETLSKYASVSEADAAEPDSSMLRELELLDRRAIEPAEDHPFKLE